MQTYHQSSCAWNLDRMLLWAAPKLSLDSTLNHNVTIVFYFRWWGGFAYVIAKRVASIWLLWILYHQCSSSNFQLGRLNDPLQWSYPHPLKPFLFQMFSFSSIYFNNINPTRFGKFVYILSSTILGLRSAQRPSFWLTILLYLRMRRNYRIGKFLLVCGLQSGPNISWHTERACWLTGLVLHKG